MTAETKDVYVPKAETTKINATYRISIKMDTNYVTVEYSEERLVPNLPDVDIDKERADLWFTVTQQCEDQADLIQNTLNKNQ